MPYGYYYIYDYWYIIPMLAAMVFALIAQAGVKSTFNKYSRVRTRRGMTGADAAEAVLRDAGVTGVAIERVAGKLTDHYDPKANVIRLSESVYGSDSVASLGVAAHEAGHAVQYAQNYGPIKLRGAIYPAVNLGSKLAFPMVIIGLLLEGWIRSSNDFGQTIALVGVLLYGLVVVFQLVTLPVEFNASRRAIAALDGGDYLAPDELPGAKATLRAAAMTYVASLAVTLIQFLRLLVMVLGRSRRD